MKKTIDKTKKSSFLVVASTIQEKSQTFEFCFDEKECQALAKRFDLPKVSFLKGKLELYRDEFVHVKGKFFSDIFYKSVISLEEFKSSLHEEFEVLFSENPPLKSDEIIDLIERGRIDLKEVIFEQFGLSLDPFPKKKEEPKEFIYQEDEMEKTNPFNKLKHLF